jgi:uncharacterized OsmC-like protein
MSEIRESILNVRTALASKPDAGPAPDRPATAVMEDGLRCRAEGGDGWAIVTDMPAPVGGGGSAPTPGWLIRAALASCAATTIAMRAAELEIALTRLEVTAESETDMRGLLGVGNGVEPGPVTARLRVELAAEGADEQQLEELVRWADSHSPVGDCVQRAVPVELEITAG